MRNLIKDYLTIYKVRTKYIGEVGLDFTGKLKEKRENSYSAFDYICSYD